MRPKKIVKGNNISSVFHYIMINQFTVFEKSDTR